MLVHTVFFYLKVDVTEEQTAAFVKQVEELGSIETVHSIHVGTPAATPKRPIIQADYAVGLTVLFNSLEDHDVYQVHQVHNDFIASNSHLWEKVVIYDAD
ncbi:MAG: Dabb family protein [Verrucomicrobia bacterium]|nr:Dabb family protein [Verrucomicrobiota bacterium]